MTQRIPDILTQIGFLVRLLNIDKQLVYHS